MIALRILKLVWLVSFGYLCFTAIRWSSNPEIVDNVCLAGNCFTKAQFFMGFEVSLVLTVLLLFIIDWQLKPYLKLKEIRPKAAAILAVLWCAGIGLSFLGAWWFDGATPTEGILS